MKTIYLFVVLVIINLSSLSFAQEKNEKDEARPNEEIPNKSDEKKEKDKELTEKEKAIKERSKVKFRLLPGPTYDPAIGFGLTVIPMAIYYPDKKDLVSPPSQTALYYMISSNKSTGGGISQKFYLSEDHWRIDMGAFAGGIVWDAEIPISEKETITIKTTNKFRFVKLYVDRRVWGDLFFGLGVKGISSWTVADNSQYQDLIDQYLGKKGPLQFGALVKTYYDSRDNIFYPYKGYYGAYAVDYNAENDSFDAYWGNIYDFRIFQEITSHRYILAGHLYGKAVSASAPDNVKMSYGRAMGSTQRGFVSGEHFGKNFFSSDLELRILLPYWKEKLGVAVFGNFGKLYGDEKPNGDIESFGEADWLIGGGVGLKYFILPYERIHVVLDAAWADESFALYFGMRSPF